MRHKLLIGLALTALVFAGLYLTVPTATDAPADFSVQYGPTTPWLEVYIDGALDSEWQPADGEVYWLLLDMIERQEGEVLMLARR